MKNKLTSRWSLKEPLYLKKTDKRYSKHLKQLKTNGFSDAETWSLDSVIAEFILPRLIRFKEVNIAYPGMDMPPEKWDAALDEMIFAFDWSLHCGDDKYDNLSKEEGDKNWNRYDEGMKLFAKWFRQLWW
jgi:hypothetical protein